MFLFSIPVSQVRPEYITGFITEASQLPGALCAAFLRFSRFGRRVIGVNIGNSTGNLFFFGFVEFSHIYRKNRQLIKQCGLPVILFHDWRHTAASLLAPHVTPKQLQEFLGHEDISTTLGIYPYVLDDQKRETTKRKAPKSFDFSTFLV